MPTSEMYSTAWHIAVGIVFCFGTAEQAAVLAKPYLSAPPLPAQPLLAEPLFGNPCANCTMRCSFDALVSLTSCDAPLDCTWPTYLGARHLSYSPSIFCNQASIFAATSNPNL